MKRMELRRGIRFPVHLNCRVSPLSKAIANLSGHTVNISRSGLLVSFDGTGPLPALPEVGKAARVVLELPGVPYFRGWWLACGCEVARVVEQTGVPQVAFKVKRWRVVPAAEDSPAVQ